MASFDPNPFWTALTTLQRDIALGDGEARRFPADVIPFAAVGSRSVTAATALRDLLAPGEAIYVAGLGAVSVERLRHAGTHPCLQMHFAGELLVSQAGAEEAASTDPLPIEQLSSANAGEMLALTHVAFPGFFRARTPILGSYFGIRKHGELIAMAGERLQLPGQTEISGVCTHPEHLGRGHAARLVSHLLRLHGARGVASVLHVLAENRRAIALYERLGFVMSGEIAFQMLRRTR